MYHQYVILDKRIILYVEEHEKLKANNAFLLEEKTQAEEQKQIITG